MKIPHPLATAAAFLAVAALPPASAARLFDSFNKPFGDPACNWTSTVTGGGSASIASGQLTLTCPASAVSTATATLAAGQAQILTGNRHSILVRTHTAVASKTVFFLWAIDTVTGNKLELKINDQTSTTMTAGYYNGGGANYQFVGSIPYAPGPDGERLYMGFREASGTTYWEVSTDGITWNTVGSLANPVATGNMTFAIQHKEFATTTSSTKTIVDCFNYKATGAGFHRIEDKTYNRSTSQTDGWNLYVEAFCDACNYQDCNPDPMKRVETHYACQASTVALGSTGITCNNMSSSFDCMKAKFNCLSPTLHMDVNCVDSSQHASDGSWINFQMSTDRLSNPAAANWYMNMYRYQNLAFKDADVWTYRLQFKFDRLDTSAANTILQGLEFPINKYLSNGDRLQAAVAWYPVRSPGVVVDASGAYKGVLKVWTGTGWDDGGAYQSVQYAWLRPSSPSDTSQGFYEIAFTVGLHDGNVYYSGFQLGFAGSPTSYTWNHSFPADTNNASTSQRIVPAFQLDNNKADTVTTTKNVWVQGWDIDWADERLP